MPFQFPSFIHEPIDPVLADFSVLKIFQKHPRWGNDWHRSLKQKKAFFLSVFIDFVLLYFYFHVYLLCRRGGFFFKFVLRITFTCIEPVHESNKTRNCNEKDTRRSFLAYTCRHLIPLNSLVASLCHLSHLFDSINCRPRTVKKKKNKSAPPTLCAAIKYL